MNARHHTALEDVKEGARNALDFLDTTPAEADTVTACVGLTPGPALGGWTPAVTATGEMVTVALDVRNSCKSLRELAAYADRMETPHERRNFGFALAWWLVLAVQARPFTLEDYREAIQRGIAHAFGRDEGDAETQADSDTETPAADRFAMATA